MLPKTIIISDIHLGQRGLDGTGYCSLLTPLANIGADYKRQAKLKQDKFFSVVHDFARNDNINLIIAGDGIDLAMASIRECMEDLRDLAYFLPINQLFYVVGNHDHKLWSLHQEYTRIILPMSAKTLPCEPSTFVVTPKIGMQYHMLEKFLDVKTNIVYPILNINNSELVVTHGHLFGDIYVLVSSILKDYLVRTNHLEADSVVNAPLTEFIYWLVGQMGEKMGVNGLAETIYADMQKGKDSSVNAVIDRAVDVFLIDGLVKGIPDSWEKWIAKKVFKQMIKGTLPHINTAASSDRQKDTSLSRKSVLDWFNNVLKESNIKTFVSGHTHVSDDFIIDSARCLNPGGWEVEPGKNEVDSAVILIEDEKVSMVKV